MSPSYDEAQLKAIFGISMEIAGYLCDAYAADLAISYHVAKVCKTIFQKHLNMVELRMNVDDLSVVINRSMK